MTTLQRTILILCLLAMASLCALAVVPPFASITLAWDKAPTHGPNITYRLKWGTSTETNSANYYNNTIDVGTNLTATVNNPTAGYLYFRAVAVTPEGLESLPSNIVTTTNYPAAPLQLRITTNTTASVKIEGWNGKDWVRIATVLHGKQTTFTGPSTAMFRTIAMGPLP